ncbi:lipid-A-disaccharide synthase [Aphanothece hegewaldii CCALA 016]|uniref:Lipid-A-disaccharide synthase n=1 Tax=Aphanothece hegewaldii CCALA 016 TaxID=2107694 RepID=A0A2T1LRJ5_9CHRO|nr:lipid-A-disaccharide synthase [Aphanothece hegewaldii]PSF31179.1 lipid-A-disaccharide synthase [Aphanothece hegewaldii CCALA 016]
MQPIDILILSNGPGEISTWVRPVVKSLRQQLGMDVESVRISVVLSPCGHAMGTESDVVRSYPEVNRVQSPEHFFSFLLQGKTAENWDWRNKGIVLFLGGDQFFPVVIGRRLGYQTVIYAEREARWLRWVTRYGVKNQSVVTSVPSHYQSKLTVVGDLMVDIPHLSLLSSRSSPPMIALLPGSKPSKLFQGVPLCLAIAEQISQQFPMVRFVLPVAPTLNLSTLAKFADRQYNPIIETVNWTEAQLFTSDAQTPYFLTSKGLKVELFTQFPAYEMLSLCHFALTTIGANTAELATLGLPFIVLLPIQQLDAMRTWDGIPGILASLPLIGVTMAKIINLIVLAQGRRLYAWPNIWAKQEIVPELLGLLSPADIAQIGIDWLNHPEKLDEIRRQLLQICGEPGAAQKMAQIVTDLVKTQSDS